MVQTDLGCCLLDLFELAPHTHTHTALISLQTKHHHCTDVLIVTAEGQGDKCILLIVLVIVRDVHTQSIHMFNLQKHADLHAHTHTHTHASAHTHTHTVAQ